MSQVIDSLAPKTAAIDLIRKHYRMQRGRMISHWSEDDHGMIVYSAVSSVPMWNHAAWLGGSTTELATFARRFESLSQNRGRRPAIYIIQNGLDSTTAAAALQNHGYDSFDEESWMVYSPIHQPDSVPDQDLAITPARSAQELTDFMEVFYSAFQIQDPAFAAVLKRQALDSPQDVQHYVAYSNSKAVCVGTLIQHEGSCCIYNVGTKPGARNRGYAAILMQQILNHALNQNQNHIFLQTSHGSAAERLYLRLGFKSVFIRRGFRIAHWNPQRNESKSFRPFRRHPSAHDPVPSANSHRATIPDRLLAALQELSAHSDVPLDTILVSSWINVLARQNFDETVSFALLDQFMPGASDLPQVVQVAPPGTQTVLEWLQSFHALRKSLTLGAHSSDAAAGNSQACASGVRILKNPALDPATQQTPCEIVWSPAAPSIVEFQFDPALHNSLSIVQLASHLINTLQQMAHHSLAPICSLEILSQTEIDQILKLGSAAPDDLSAVPNIVELFERQVERTPNAIALVESNPSTDAKECEAWSYRQLNRKANQVAHYLRNLGVQPDSCIGLCAERSLDFVILLLAVLKSGAAAVPLDPDQPTDRLGFYIQDTRMPLLLADKDLESTIIPNSTRLIRLETLWQSAACESSANPLPVLQPQHAAYIIYTSGSTGTPKGVVVPHSAIARHCLDIRDYYNLSPADRVLQFASFHFDAALEQTLPPLIAGASVVLRGKQVWSAAEFAALLATLELTLVDLPTAYWHQLARQWAEQRDLVPPNPLRLVIVGGEAMLPESVRLWKQTPLKHVQLINAYGPTEATITATTFDVTCWEESDLGAFNRVPIGQIRGARSAFVVDRYQHLAPLGAIGELYIGGPCLARGYLNRPELTQSRFIPNPFSASPTSQLYKTGDLVRLLPSGTLEFLGRADDQVKIRGFRIELGEIETALAQHSAVKIAVALAREDHPGDKQLVAYFVPARTPAPTEKDLRFFLKQRLPEYMIPSAFVPLESLPVTSTGKVDRRNLPPPQTKPAPTETVFRGPSDPLELRLQLLFEKILRRHPIPVDASFFELGGDSLQALELIVAIERAIGRNLPLETLFQSSTVQGLARILHNPAALSETSAIVPLQTSGRRPPFFLIHTTPGDVLGYGNLIYHFNNDQPCYGIQSRGLFRADLSHSRIEDMAGFYIQLIRSIQPLGPYYLGGWCYGGIVAVEMARQLMAAGESIGLLALLETLAPPPSPRVLQYYTHRFGCFMRMEPRNWLTYFREKIRYFREFQVPKETRFHRLGWSSGEPQRDETETAKLAQLQHVYEINLQALHHYRSKPYPGRVTLFNAAEPDPAMIPDPQYGWTGIASEIVIHSVPGTHDTMLAEPHVAILAKKLDTCLHQCQRRADSLPAGNPTPVLSSPLPA